MKNNASQDYKTPTGLFISILSVVAFGFMVQLLENHMEHGMYSISIVYYWMCFVTVMTGVFLVSVVTHTVYFRHPDVYKVIHCIILLLLMCGILYSAEDVLSDFYLGERPIILNDYRGKTLLKRSEVIREALFNSKLFGHIENCSEMKRLEYNAALWRWEENAVLPALTLRFGLWNTVFYVAVSIMCMYNLICNRKFIPQKMEWTLNVGGKSISWITPEKVVYYAAAVVFALQLLGPALIVLGVCRYTGGVPFCATNVADIELSITDVTPLAAICYLFIMPCTSDCVG